MAGAFSMSPVVALKQAPCHGQVRRPSPVRTPFTSGAPVKPVSKKLKLQLLMGVKLTIMSALRAQSTVLSIDIEQQNLSFLESFNLNLLFLAWLQVELVKTLELIHLSHVFDCCSESCCLEMRGICCCFW